MALSKHSSKGFTIVELLVVVVVLAILAMITLINFNGARVRTTNTKIISNVQGYYKVVMLYKAITGDYPPVPGENKNNVSMICLGTGYPSGRCGVVSGNTIEESPAFMDTLMDISSSKMPVNLDLGAVSNESFIGAVYGIDTTGPPAPHAGYGRVIEWFLIGEDQDCILPNAYSYATGSGNTACEIFLEATA